jgi:hypothetical protein
MTTPASAFRASVPALTKRCHRAATIGHLQSLVVGGFAVVCDTPLGRPSLH